MSMQSSTGLYDEDLYCSNPSNLITNEVQTLQTPGLDDYYFIIPFAAPFYVETLELRNHTNGQLYVEGTDYVIGHYFVDAMDSLKRPIAGSIRFLKKSISGQARIKYHTVGGQWGLNENAILAELSNKQLNPITRSWEQIEGLPARFPSIAHDQQVNQLIGSEDINQSIQDIAATIEAAAAGTSQSHIDDMNNPHGVNKTQVGLSQVQNLPLATLAQALNSNFAAGYSTPQSVYHAINYFALTPLNAHIANTNNPHGVTKSQVGLPLTPNMALANAAQAIDPLNNTVLMSPYTTALMIQATLSTDRLDDLELAFNTFIVRQDNPHNVTAAQVGTLTTAQIQDLIVASGSGEAISFNGYTFDQFMQLVAEEDEIAGDYDAMAQAVSAARITLDSVGENYNTDITQTNNNRDVITPSEVYAGDQGYAIVGSQGATNIIALPSLTYPPMNNGGTTGIVILDNNVLSIASDGSVTKHNAAGTLVPHSSYATGGSFVPANSAWEIHATKTALYIFCGDNRLVRTTGVSNATQLSADCAYLWTNTENAQPGEMVVFKDNAGTIYAYGLAAFVTAFNALISAWTTASIASTLMDLVITDTHLIALFGDEQDELTRTVKVYTIDRSSGVVFTEIAAPVGSPVTIAGSFAHSAVVMLDGTVAWFGVVPHCADEIDIPVREVGCGKDFTVFIDRKGFVEFWGDVPNNALLWNDEVMYEHV